MKLSKLFSTFVLLFLFTSVQVLADDPEVELDEDGNPIVKLDEAPEWVLVDGQGDTVSSATLADKPYVLHFWATWCPYCKRFQPGLDYIAADYIESGIPTYAVSWWENPGAKPVKEMESRGLMFPVLLEGDAVAKAFGVIGTPTTIFVSHEGEIIYRHTGFDPNDPELRVAYEQLKSDFEAPPEPEPEDGEEDDSE